VLFLVAALFAISDMDFLPLNEALLLNDEVPNLDDLYSSYEGCELVFSVRSVTRRVSILGWASERYDLEVGNVLMGNLDHGTVFLYTFPNGMLSGQITSIKEGQGLIVFAVPDSANDYMEGFNTAEGSWVTYLYIH